MLSILGLLGSGLGIGIGLSQAATHLSAHRSVPPPLTPTTTHPPSSSTTPFVPLLTTPIPVVSTGVPITLSGDGLGAAVFGQPATVVMNELEPLLGPPTGRSNDAGDCTVDAMVRWPTIDAYFLQGRFVGYNTGPLQGGPGDRAIPDATTTNGLRVGDTLAQAEQLYPGSFSTSYAQDGSWYVMTPTGQLAGLLIAYGGVTAPNSQIADISAGSVGCPAVSP